MSGMKIRGVPPPNKLIASNPNLFSSTSTQWILLLHSTVKNY